MRDRDAVLEAKLIGAGVTHFGVAFARYMNNGGSWTDASNYAGFSSPTISINTGWGDSKPDKNGVNQNPPVVAPKSDTDGGGKGNDNQSSSSSTDVANGFVGTYLTALDKYATNNASYVYRYGTQAVSATALTEANAARMLGIANRAQVLGNTLGMVTGTYTLYNTEMGRRSTGIINYKGYADGIIGIAGGIAGTVVTFGLVSNPVGWGIVATGAAIYGIGSFAYDAYNYKN